MVDPALQTSSETGVGPVVYAMFNNRDDLIGATRALKQKGFEDVSVLAPPPGEERDLPPEYAIPRSSMVEEGTLIGAAVGAVGTGLVSAAAASTLFFIPILEGLEKIGPLLSFFAGAGVGSIIGSGIGAILGMGVPDRSGKHARAGTQPPGALLTVRTKTAAESESVRYMLQETTGAKAVFSECR